ncbi:MAG TPA: aminotransferase class I/II-fold pyridoxal phosphate-dependent enzyme [Phycisphaerae bacterium]|nr:aminotransferase class I/II-fold pyridoxal phosphate-dependent enzyme [Phycisphaerae bacterium]
MAGGSNEPFTIDVSTRLRRLPPYLFARLNALKAEKRRAGSDIIDLGMGNPIDPSPSFVLEKLAEASKDARNHRYSVSVGLYNLRREVALKYKRRYGVELDPDREVVATIGSKEGFSHLMLALLSAGDTVIVGDPAYPIHMYAVTLAGGSVMSVPLGNDDAFLARIEHTLQNLQPRPKLVIFNYPHNPSAITIEPEFWAKAVAMAKKFNVLLISDFAYGETCFGDYKAPSFLATPGAKDVGVEFSTMSKPYNMAGWRVGFCCGNHEMVRALSTIKGYYDYGHFAPIQIASIMALRHGDEFVQEQCAIYEKRRDILVKGLRKIGWDVETPRASMFVWARVSDKHLAGQSTLDFCFRLLDDADVAIAPGAGFGPNGEGYVRIALVENELRIKQALRQMDAALNGKVKHQRPKNKTPDSPAGNGHPSAIQDAANSSIIGG